MSKKKSATTTRTTKKKAAPKGANQAKKSTTKKKPVKKSTAKANQEVIYDDLEVRLYKEGTENGPITVELAKKFLGWQEETDELKFGNAYLLKDRKGNKVRCTNNLTNRPYTASLANDWMLEILRKKWRFNGETMIIDRLGGCQDCQHRLIALVLASQEAQLDHDSKIDRWKPYWNGDEPHIDGLVVLGIDDSDDTVNTINTGKPRSRSDVLYRSEHFKNFKQEDRLGAARVCDWALKLIWHRTGKDQDAFTPKRSHSESLEYLGKHKKILDSVNHIYAERESFKGLIQPGHAAGLLFLQGTSTSKLETYEGDGNDLDYNLWDQAEDFWVNLSAGAESLKPLVTKLRELQQYNGSFVMQATCALVSKAWNLITDDKKVTSAGLKLKVEFDEAGHPTLMENPTIGGLDIGGEVEDQS